MDKTQRLLSLIQRAKESNENRTKVGHLLVQKNLLELELALKSYMPLGSAKPIGRPKAQVEEKIRKLVRLNSNITTKELISQCPEVSAKTVRRYLKKLQ